MDATGFEAYVRARGATLFRVAFLLSGDHHLAEDLVQQALLRLAGRWGHVTRRRRPGRVRAPDHLPRARLLVAPAPPPGSGGVGGRRRGGAGPERRGRGRRGGVRAARWPGWRRGSGRCWCCATTRTCTEAQTAEVLGVRVGTVKSQTRDGLARLRELAPELSEHHGAGVGL